MHYAGINLYDSAFRTTEDVLKALAPSNAFDPKSVEAMKATEQTYEYRLAAGPLPADASPACCSYEFSIRLRFPNDFEMYHFVAMLRRCVRVDHYTQAMKMQEYLRKTQVGAGHERYGCVRRRRLCSIGRSTRREGNWTWGAQVVLTMA